MKRAAAGLLALLSLGVAAGPLAVRGPDGTRWRINDDEEPIVVERSLANGQLDVGYGRKGRVALDFGGRDVDVTALRVDNAGRLWLAGNTQAAGMGAALVQRLQPDGQLDTRWAVGGRSTAVPAGQRVQVSDLLPMPDGSAWVAGDIVGPQGERDAALWRLKADGALDYGFGVGGVWRRTGPERSGAQSLAAGPGGGIAFGLQLLTGYEPGREVHAWAPGERQLRLVPAQPLGPQNEDDDEAWLLWAGRGWVWRPGPQVAPLAGLPVADLTAPGPASAPPQAPAPGDGGHTALNPFVQADAASAPVAPDAPADELPWGWLIAGLAGLVAMGWVWRRGRPG